MELDIIFFIAFLVFFIGLIISIFSKPQKIKKWEAILICLIGVIAYGSLFGAVCYDEIHINTVEVTQKKLSKTENKRQNLNLKPKPINKPSNNNGKIIGDTDSKIYHVPNGVYYQKELEKESNNIYFNTVEEAENAGYRASKR